jgi:hypothetical protein
MPFLGRCRIDIESVQTSLLFGEPKDVQLQYLAWSRNGKTIYYRRNEAKSRRLMAHQVETGEEKELFRYQNAVGPAPAVSPDGRWLAFGAKGALLVMPAEGGQPENLGVRGEGVVLMSAHPDGRRILGRLRLAGDPLPESLINQPSRGERLGGFLRGGLVRLTGVAELPGILGERRGLIDHLS